MVPLSPENFGTTKPPRFVGIPVPAKLPFCRGSSTLLLIKFRCAPVQALWSRRMSAEHESRHRLVLEPLLSRICRIQVSELCIPQVGRGSIFFYVCWRDFHPSVAPHIAHFLFAFRILGSLASPAGARTFRVSLSHFGIVGPPARSSPVSC